MDLSVIGVENPYYEALADRYAPQVNLCIKGGKLVETDGWGNVARHCLVQAAASEVLGQLLQLEDSVIRAIAMNAACHDWKKRMGIKPGDFTQADREYANGLLASAAPDQEVLGAVLTPQFLVIAQQGTAVNFLHGLQFYIDDVAKGGTLVPFDEQIDEVSARNPHPDDDIEKQLGRPYWEVEREVGHGVEAELFYQLMACGTCPSLKRQEDIPAVILAEIKQRGGEQLAE